MELYGKIKCVTYNELVDGNVISAANYRKLSSRFTIARRGCKNRPALIVFDSMPEYIRRRYHAAYPDAERQMEAQMCADAFALDRIEQDSRAAAFYRTYKTAAGDHLTDSKQYEYTTNAQILNELIRLEGGMRAAHRKSGYTHTNLIWNAVMNTCERLRETYFHTLPKSKERLRKVMSTYRQNGYASLVSGKEGNKNTLKIREKEARLLLKLRISGNFLDSQIFEEYNRQAQAKGLTVIKSENSVRNFLNNPQIMPLWYGAVRGELAFKQKYVSQFSTEMPMFRDALWYADGTKLNLYYRDDKGKLATTMVYEVMDAYSEMFLGFDISDKENFKSQYNATRMALEVSGQKPYEYVTDNQGGHKKPAAQMFYKKVCHLRRFTMPYNGQSKTIESAFGRFQQQVLRKIWHFTGMNITTNSASSRPNLELLEANKAKLPTFDRLKEIYAECRREWNASAHSATGMAREDMYRASHNPKAEPLTELDRLIIFQIPLDKPVAYDNTGMRFTLEGRKYHYDVYDLDGLRDENFAMRSTGKRFHVLYDPKNMSRIELWEPRPNDAMRFVAEATPKVVIRRATQERTSAENEFMRAQMQRSRQVRAVIQLTAEDFKLMEGVAKELETPKPKNISREMWESLYNDYASGKITSPVQFPVSAGEGETDLMEEVAQTVGSYTKQLSNITHDSVFSRF